MLQWCSIYSKFGNTYICIKRMSVWGCQEELLFEELVCVQSNGVNDVISLGQKNGYNFFWCCHQECYSDNLFVSLLNVSTSDSNTNIFQLFFVVCCFSKALKNMLLAFHLIHIVNNLLEFITKDLQQLFCE